MLTRPSFRLQQHGGQTKAWKQVQAEANKKPCQITRLGTSEEAHDRLDSSSLNSLIIGYVKQGYLHEALAIYQKKRTCDSLLDHSYVSLLKGCAGLRNLGKGQELHAEITRRLLLEKNVFLGSTLVDMYAKCGCLGVAREVFDTLREKNLVSWTALISGYVDNAQAEEALYCVERMNREGVPSDAITFVSSLKACASIGDVEKGQEIHGGIINQGLEDDVMVGSTLVVMYAKCGLLATAQVVFDNLPVLDVVLWSTLIVAYVEGGMGEEALKCYNNMQYEGICPDNVIYVSVLKACGSIGSVQEGQIMHIDIINKGVESDHFIANTLVDFYVKCGLLREAQEVLYRNSSRSVVSWNALLAGPIEHAHFEDALECFTQMQLEEVTPDAVTLICILKTCGSIGAAHKGHEIHADLTRQGQEGEAVIGGALVDMYAKCGLFVCANGVFDKLSVRDTVSWNGLITGYADHGLGQETLDFIDRMWQEGILPQDVTFVAGLRACASIGAITKGREMHMEIVRRGLEGAILVGSSLVDMYVKCRSLVDAQLVFDELPVRDLVLWNVLLAGYVDCDFGKDMLHCFQKMQEEGISPDGVSFICSLKACDMLELTRMGQEIHTELMGKGYEEDIFVGNTLVDMYVNSGMLGDAQKVFDRLPVRTVVSWNALIVGYAEQGRGMEAVRCYEKMQHDCVVADNVTFVCCLKACGMAGLLNKGEEVHARIVKKGFDVDVLVGNTVVDMYLKCGSSLEAQCMFDKLPVRTLVSWNALLVGYVEYGNGEAALTCFEQMQEHGASPDDVTFVCCLRACGSVGAIIKGQDVHIKATERGLESDAFISKTLVDMYTKCGLLKEALHVHQNFPVRTVYSWNAIIAGYSQRGEKECTFLSVDKMVGEGIDPNPMTCMSILNVCNHTGALENALMSFETVNEEFGIIPTIQHVTCVVDLLGRAGCIDKAVAIINEMPFHPGLVVWHVVLGACRKWGDVDFGRRAFMHAMQLNKESAAAYVSMSNIYADASVEEVGVDDD